MSYILDALKRAESERERGVVPGVHSQSMPMRRPVAGLHVVVKPLMLAGAALGLAMLGILTWRTLSPASTVGTAPVVVVSRPTTTQVEATTPTALVPLPAPAAKAIEASQPVKALPLAVSPKPAPRPQAVAVAAATQAPVSPRVTPIGELPADVRQTLPKLVISGSTYSDNPSYRMLIINGEVFREGEKPAPDLQLEQIKAKAAVLNFKGLRYSMAY